VAAAPVPAASGRAAPSGTRCELFRAQRAHLPGRLNIFSHCHQAAREASDSTSSINSPASLTRSAGPEPLGSSYQPDQNGREDTNAMTDRRPGHQQVARVLLGGESLSMALTLRSRPQRQT